ncbi:MULTISPECIES: luciferase-like monooxygenase [unclassified Tatumella]|uniref:luciferase-like monooxygenase n=1 Tax=unclassified Tatumella TaxID=2649542 RepID=UPI001BB037E9|nr:MULTISPECIES: luciferase-like monooxygenase [unclassified Tatumella]MBS0877391.1 luciferase-like monooxygenase [Tatumella sp. JGM82]MBS0890736.1 luciferase-like monooxygenase [Tatumella sp. JGM94]MBS0893478.1 luciferase-like monooxygenase [Tatumella sp. JGM130]MBS0901788.1 luciferase-like monooxygenase [Tatumella sp. JGM100]
MSELKPFKLSVLDLSPVPEHSDPRTAFSNSLALAKYAESAGYHRYWLAEHHNMTGIASAATSVLIGYLAANTRHLRLGSGGVMLPNHAPLVIAEQFGTLATLYPDRIDLGIGRAPGSDQRTMMALRRHMSGNAEDNFPQDIEQLIRWFDAPAGTAFDVQPVPGTGLRVPVWLLGSSLYSAQLAARMGLPFAFASHFAPDMLSQAVTLYRENFRPSDRLAAPYVMIGVNVIAAESKARARFLFTSQQQQFINLRRGMPGPLPAPVENMDTVWSPAEKYGVDRALGMSLVGDQASVTQGLASLQQQYQPDELMINGQIFDNEARIYSFSLAMAAAESLKH